MTEEDLLINVFNSLIRFLQDFREDVAPNAVYVDFDAHAQTNELPNDPVFMGPAGMGLTEETPGEYEVVFSFGIGTYKDKNLAALRPLVSKLFGRLTIGKTLPVYDHQTGEVVSWMVIRAPRAVTPITKAEVRSLQFVEMTALLDPGAASKLR